MTLKRTHVCAVLALALAILLSGCNGFFTSENSSSGSGLITGTGTPSKFVFVANTGSAQAGSVSAYTVGGDNTLTNVGSPVATNNINGTAVVSDSSGQNLYVASLGNPSNSTASPGAIDSYSIDSTSGALTLTSGSGIFVSGTSNPTALALTSSFLFAAYQNPVGIEVFSISNGTLTQSSVVPYGLGSNHPTSLAIMPSSGGFLYASDGSAIYVFKVNSDGTLTATAQAGSSPFQQASNQIVIAPNGKFVYVAAGSNGVSALSIDNTAGTLKLIKTYSTGGNAVALTTDPQSRWVYVVNNNTNKISGFTIGSDGSLTAMSSSFSTGSSPAGIAIGPSSTAAYVTNSSDSTVGVYTLNSDGTLNFLGTNKTDNGPQGIVVTQ
jgi:6-phosphogluconolactonase (cycloisomerase 2 family)